MSTKIIALYVQYSLHSYIANERPIFQIQYYLRELRMVKFTTVMAIPCLLVRHHEVMDGHSMLIGEASWACGRGTQCLLVRHRGPMGGAYHAYWRGIMGLWVGNSMLIGEVSLAYG